MFHPAIASMHMRSTDGRRALWAQTVMAGLCAGAGAVSMLASLMFV